MSLSRERSAEGLLRRKDETMVVDQKLIRYVNWARLYSEVGAIIPIVGCYASPLPPLVKLVIISAITSIMISFERMTAELNLTRARLEQNVWYTELCLRFGLDQAASAWVQNGQAEINWEHATKSATDDIVAAIGTAKGVELIEGKTHENMTMILLMPFRLMWRAAVGFLCSLPLLLA